MSERSAIPTVDDTEPVAPRDDVKLCDWPGCQSEAGGKSKYCDEHKEAASRGRRPKVGASTGGKTRVKQTRFETPRDKSISELVRTSLSNLAVMGSLANPRLFPAVQATVENVAESYEALAKEYPQAEPYIRAVFGSSVVMNAAASTVIMGVAVAGSFGWCPGSWLNVLPPFLPEGTDPRTIVHPGYFAAAEAAAAASQGVANGAPA